jgi:hypothetical protein
MKRFTSFLALLTLVVAVSIAITQNPALPQASQSPITSNVEPIIVENLFAWARGESVNWAQGAIFAALGLVGGLITIFTLIGGAIPGTFGQAQIEATQEQLDRLSKKLEDLIVNSEAVDAGAIDAVEKAVNNLRDDLRAERWRQFFIAAILYALLAAFFAVALATNLLQAIVIGAGWTGLLGSIGLKRDFEQRKEIKDEVLNSTIPTIQWAEEIDKRLKQLEKKPQEEITNFNLTNLGFLKSLSPPGKLMELKDRVRMAQKL